MARPNARRGSEALVEGLLPRLLRTAYYLTRDENEAEDAVQETIARFLEAIGKDPRRVRSPAAWCAAVLARLCIGRRRGTIATGLEEDAAVDARQPEAFAMASELREQVRRQVLDLPSEEREAVCLHVFGELTIREVARETGVSRSCAHERVRKGLDRLRRRLEPAVLGGVAASPPHFVNALRAIPVPAPSPALTAAVAQPLATAAAAGGAASLVPSSFFLGGILMLKSKAILIAATAILLATAIGLGVRLATVRRGSEPQADPGDAVRSQAPEQASVPKGRVPEVEDPLAAAPALAVAAKDIEGLLAAALEAFERKDAAAFRDAFLSLLDASPASWPAVIDLVRTTGSFNAITAALSPNDETLARELIDAIAQRSAKLGGLADAILTRDADPDDATIFAFDLLRFCRVESERPAGEQAASLLWILERAIEIEGEGVDWNTHVILAGDILGELRPRPLLSRLHALLERPDVSATNRVAVLRVVARIGGGEAVAILRAVRDRAAPQVRSHLMNNLAMYEYGPEVEGFIQESLDLEEDPSVRSGLLRALARREGGRTGLGGRLNDASLDLRERLTILEALFERGTDEEKEIAWRHVEASGADLQDEVLGTLANTEPRALDLLFRRLESEDEVSQDLASGLRRLDAKIIETHRDRIERLANDSTRPSRIRAAAASALAKGDAGRAE
ncbi:MAG: RNA polymerase sigma factor [Planctomycetes bacterium]|nr:RNA polymerase sigma factor [Planctomycetota bacterium]